MKISVHAIVYFLHDPYTSSPSKSHHLGTIMRISILQAAFLLLVAMPLGAQQSLWLADPLQPLFPDSNSTVQLTGRYEADFPSGTSADVHLLLNAQPGDTVAVAATIAGEDLPASDWSEIIDVPVEQNTGLDSRTEAYTNQKNPYVIRRAPFRVYEALQPLAAPSVISRNPHTALRLSIPAHRFPRPGRYTIDITARTRTWTGHGTFTATIHSVSVPPVAEGTFFYTNWFSLPQMEEKHRLARWTPEWFAMLDRYASLMAHGRQNCIIIPGELMSIEGGRIMLDEKRLLSFVEVFRRYGFRYFESPHLMYRGDEDDWADPELKVVLTKRRYGTAEAKADVDTIISLIKSFATRHGLTRSWLQHISDEPTAVQAACYRDVVRQVRGVYPDIRIMEATSDRDTLAGSVDVWCPTIDDFQKNEEFFRARRNLGEDVLVYTCLIPGGQWLNRLLDQERLRQVYFGWGAAAYNTSGFLHWGLNQYLVPDPFQQSVVHHPSPVATANNFLPAGDSHVIYPGPLSSTRFEAHRLGIEDFELLQLLQKKDKVKANDLIGRIFKSYTDYSTDIGLYRATRKALLEAL